MKQQFVYQRDTQVFQAKPNSREAAGINVRLAEVANQAEGTLDQFIDDSLRYSVAPFDITEQGGASLTADLWRGQQIFLFDVDNKPESGYEPVDGEEALMLFQAAGLPPAAIWTTMSHTPEQPRLRVMLVSLEAIGNIDQARGFMAVVAERVNKGGISIVDSAALKPAQLFFAGKELIYKQVAARVDATPRIDDIHAVPKVRSCGKRKTGVGEQASGSTLLHDMGNSVVEWIENGEIASLQQWLTQQKILPLRQGVSRRRSGLTPDNNWPFWVPAELGKLILQGLPVDTTIVVDGKFPTRARQADKPLFIRDREALYALYHAVPLMDFFGVPNNLQCLVHPDRKASATIVCYEHETGFGALPRYQYFCHSNQCRLHHRIHDGAGPAAADLIDLVAAIRGCTNAEALEFLNAVFGIQMAPQGWKEEKRNAIVWLLDRLQAKDLKATYPSLMRLLKPHKDKLVAFLSYVLDHMPSYSVTNDDRLVFSISLRSLRSIMAQEHIPGVKDVDRLNNRLLQFQELGLLGRCPDEELPEAVLHKAKEASRIGLSESVSRPADRHTSFYVIPQYQEACLAAAEVVARRKITNKESRKHMRRDVIRRRSGTEQMLKLFPQRPDLPVSNARADKLYDTLKRKMEQLLDYEGFFTKTMAINSLRGYSGAEKTAAYEKHIAAIAGELGLTWITVNKRTQKERGITGVKSGCHAWIRKQVNRRSQNQQEKQNKP